MMEEVKDSCGASSSKSSHNESEVFVENDSVESFRMWAAVSFSMMLIVIGIPLWWKTTEVQRATLPYDEIDQLDPSKLEIGMTIHVYSEYPNHANIIIKRLLLSFSNLSLFNIKVMPYKIDIDPITYEAVEMMDSLHPPPGELLLVQVPSLVHGKDILVSNHRIIYYTANAECDILGKIINDWFLEEGALRNKMVSIVDPQRSLSEDDNLNRLRAAVSYDVIFSVINSDPDVQLVWDVEADINGYIQPLLDQISNISNHYVKSQWLYLMDLGEIPKRDDSGWFTLKFSQLPHIITPLEKRLGSGISKNPCVHMILFVSSCSQRPLCFLSSDDLRVAGMISPQWGAIQVLNPSEENCQNSTLLTPNSREVMGVFVTQFHNLLGIKPKAETDKIGLMNRKGPYLRGWELDSLYRMRTVEQITSASLTLKSLAKLLGEISNIVITWEVAGGVGSSVGAVREALASLQQGHLTHAVRLSSAAFSAASTAFSDPSLLALLYFPDDQKYAVYIPLFLPIMIPVLMSLKKIYCWMLSRKTSEPSKT